VEAPVIREEKSIVKNQVIITTETGEISAYLCQRGKYPVPTKEKKRARKRARDLLDDERIYWIMFIKSAFASIMQCYSYN
jgi:hypothetical protein